MKYPGIQSGYLISSDSVSINKISIKFRTHKITTRESGSHLHLPPWCPAHTGKTQNIFLLQGRGWASHKHSLNWCALFPETGLTAQRLGLYSHLPESHLCCLLALPDSRCKVEKPCIQTLKHNNFNNPYHLLSTFYVLCSFVHILHYSPPHSTI